LDKTTDGEKEVSTKKYTPFELFLPPERTEKVYKYWKETDENFAELSMFIGRDSQSLFGDKKAFRYIRNLAYAINENLKWIYLSAHAMQDVQERLATLEKIVDEIARQLVVDLPNVKAEMEQLKATLNSSAMVTVSNFVQQMTKDIEDYKKKEEKNDLAI
jgi:sugar-specific transcriptional regulator TrmB